MRSRPPCRRSAQRLRCSRQQSRLPARLAAALRHRRSRRGAGLRAVPQVHRRQPVRVLCGSLPSGWSMPRSGFCVGSAAVRSGPCGRFGSPPRRRSSAPAPGRPTTRSPRASGRTPTSLLRMRPDRNLLMDVAFPSDPSAHNRTDAANGPCEPLGECRCAGGPPLAKGGLGPSRDGAWTGCFQGGRRGQHFGKGGKNMHLEGRRKPCI